MRRSPPTPCSAWSSRCPAGSAATCSPSSGTPRAKRLFGLNASGRSPEAATIELFRSKGLTTIPVHGPLSWSVPGCVDGWDQLRRRFGTRPWSELLAPAIAYAELGFPVSEIIAADWREAEPSLREIPTSAACYLPGGHAPAVGSVFRNPGLARSLRAIARDGRDAFYKGPWPTRSSGIRNRPAACSPTRTSPSTPAPTSSRSRPTIGATTSGSCPPTARGSPCSRCSTCSSRSTSRPWGRNRPRRCT